MKAIFALGSILALATVSHALAADAAPAASCPANHIAIVRVSKILPTGTLAGMQKAMADHSKWYTDHGYTQDRFSWGHVWTMDPVKKQPVESPDQIMTFHLNDSNVPKEKQDAGWAAYVAEYQANTQIVSTAFSCMAD
jgi:hypothetical protein